jgi:2-oxoglutarate ferredoxin oxidoreductase subunit beta
MGCCDENNSQILKMISDRSTQYNELDESEEKLTWCGGCGDYSIQKALIRALTLEGVHPHECLLSYDIGCHGNGSDKIGAYTIHGLHGRVIPLAAAAKLANPKMHVVAMGGDGGTLSEGINHLIHGIRSNYPMVFILHNNENYGLTTGQASSTTRSSQPMTGSPHGVVAPPMNVVDLVLSCNPTFVARSFSGDVKHATQMIREGLNHNGFAFIEIMQTCPTYNKATSNAWFWERIKYIEDYKNYDVTDMTSARKICADLDKEIALGVLYRNSRPSFIEGLVSRQSKKTTHTEEVDFQDIAKVMGHFR